MAPITRAPEKKRLAILEAAALTVAEQGETAAPSLIAKRAKVSEGTIFKYFSTKDELLNELYIFIRKSFRAAIPHKKPEESFNDWLFAGWQHATSWGMKHIHYVRTMQRLRLSQRLTEETYDIGVKLFNEFEDLYRAHFSSADPKVEQLQIKLLENSLSNAACSVMHFAYEVKDPEQQQACIDTGFKLFWDGIKNL